MRNTGCVGLQRELKVIDVLSLVELEDAISTNKRLVHATFPAWSPVMLWHMPSMLDIWASLAVPGSFMILVFTDTNTAWRQLGDAGTCDGGISKWLFFSVVKQVYTFL